MSSILRYIANNKQLPAPFGAVVLSYGDNQVVPFTYNKMNGVLDLDFSGPFSASTEINANDTVYVRGASFGGIHLVNDIGPNIVAWCEGSNVNADAGSVKIVEKPIIVRTNQLSVGRDPNGDNTMEESDAPFDFEKASGSPADQYNATYLFRKPLVVTYTVQSVRKYRMFNTQFEGNT